LTLAGTPPPPPAGFEWDEDKRARNLAKHGVDFRRAVQIFGGQVIEGPDRRRKMASCGSDAWDRLKVEFTTSFIRGADRSAASSAQGRPMPESKERITRVTLEEARRMKDETDYARLDAMTDEDIARAVAEDPDAAPIDADWSQASLVVPPGKQDAILWVDDDVLAWFRSKGSGYRKRMNAVLRAHMEAKKHQSR
jgi:uncharacterized protein (DUF4415 family)